jgi:hypothetical protein
MLRRCGIVLGLAAALVHCVGEDPGATGGIGGPDGGERDALPGDPDGGSAGDAAGDWDGNFGPEPPSPRTYRSHRILNDGTTTSYRNTAVAAGWSGDVVIGVRLDGDMPALGDPRLRGPGIAVAKVASDNSAVRWRQKFGGSQPVRASRVLVDENDDVYVAGNVSVDQSADVGGVPVGGNRGFIAKLRGSDGTLVWAFEIGATTNSFATSLSTKPGRPLVLAGAFRGTLSYPASSGGNLTKGGDAVRWSAFALTLDRSTGKAIWGRAFLTSVQGGIAVDADMAPEGSVELALGMAGTVTSDPSGGVVITLPSTTLSQAVFATLAATDGGHSAVKSFQTVSMSSVAIRALPGGGAVAAGEAAGSGVTVPGYNGGGTTDTWIMGLSTAHDPRWQHWFGGANAASEDKEELGCLGVDHWGRVVIGVEAFSGGGVELDSSPIPGMRTSAAKLGQLLLAKFSPAGVTQWSQAVPGGSDTSEVRSFDCGFALNGDTLFSADVWTNATPDFGSGAVSAVANPTSAVVKWSP